MTPFRTPSVARVLAAAVALGSALSLSACGKAEAAEQAPATGAAAAVPVVKLTESRTAQATPSEEVTGTLYPSQALQVGFEVGGRLETVLVKKGQAVKKGQVLATLNGEIADAQVAQAEAAVAAAEAGAAIAEDVATRTSKLQEAGGVSELQNRTSTTTAQQAKAQVLAAKAQLSQARAARRRHELKAPFAGTLIDAPEQVGATVAPGVPLFTLESLETLVLKTTVAQPVRGVLKPGSKVRVEAVGAGTSTDAAAVSLILPSADPATRRIPVEITVPNADGRFVAHTLAKAVLTVGELQDVHVLPVSAVSAANGGDHVYVVSSAGEVRRVDVQIIERRAREVVVKAASPLSKVIDYPTAGLQDGARVSVK
ncbi:efflux RND transporter periplasmic adaptor subunit [Hyalangium minutum]|uniref:Putative Co/Zn/Cd efflux system membrane fusion protein n=1 Tax=Hyalangium minutum TaxID=394096 RepID=A0A085WTQ1_9BACT|nr:efflux RND transporter periplasmic adaptor subunit [Hyalangium minutum]KFE71064.1 putative Co/Zn/Cd efflux system membrane fusion protein [Hyalangium minutum]